MQHHTHNRFTAL